MFSLILYFCVFLYSIIMIRLKQTIEKKYYLSWNGKKKKYGLIWEIYCFFFCFFPVIFVYTIRATSVGIDSKTYQLIYHDLENRTWDVCLHYYLEPAYTYLNLLAARLIGQGWGICLFNAIIIYSSLQFVLYLHKKALKAEIAVFIFFMTFFSISCNGVRQTIAMMFVLIGLSYIEKKKFWKYCICVFIALLFHISAVVCLVFYCLSSEKVVKYAKQFRMCCILCGFCVPIIYKYISVIMQKINIYAVHMIGKHSFEVSGLTFLLYLIPEFILVILLEKEATLKKNSFEKGCINLMFLQWPFLFLSLYNETVGRMAWYGGIVRVIAVPRLLNKIENRKIRKVYTIITVCWYLFYYFVMSYCLNGHGTYPYKTIFSR